MRYLLCLFCITTPLFCAIFEVSHFSELPHYVTPETLVILDIDDTLLLPAQSLGCDAWFTARLKALQATHSPEQALDKALAEWEAIRHLTQMNLVEEETAAIVGALQEKNTPVMGLTTQGLALATRTINQLAAVHIDLTKTAPSKEDHYFINEHGVLYRRGLLFTSGTKKGAALTKLLTLLKYQPKHIVFINDKATHLQDVETGLEATGIRFTGLRYAYGDTRVASFRPEIAHIQWTHSSFNHILSDAEAEALLP